MGSSSSKSKGVEGSVTSCASSTSSFSSSSTSSVRNKRKNKGFFRSPCIGSSSGAYDSDHDVNDDDDSQVSDHHNEIRVARIHLTESEPGEVKVEGYQTGKINEPDNIPSLPSNVGLGNGSSSQSFSGPSMNHSNRFLSRFSFVPDSVSFRLNRATSVGSSRAYPTPTNGDDINLYRNWPLGLSENINSSSRNSSSRRANSGDSIVSLSQTNLNNQPHELVENDSERTTDGCLLSLGETLNRRVNDRQSGASVDRNVRFSRTLSVGRLRDRVLRRSSFSDLSLSPLQPEGTTVATDENSLMSSPYPVPNMHNRFYSSQVNDAETSSLRDTRRTDLLEHRSTFLERRRRIRSQVRALQRLGSRFENLSGHERNCILSGQHRTGRCSCRANTREPSANLNDDGSARASISRIVMLAEALFEVLDEIHQQSVVLSSRPSLSAIGSVPAPIDVVESLPEKAYTKPTKLQGDDAAQCYICLVEYEEGDDMRILPCHHEFHKKCVDKWLKEIHRVCPLCRGDICRSDSLTTET